MRGSRRMDRKTEEEANGSAIRDDPGVPAKSQGDFVGWDVNEASRRLGRASG